MNPADLLHARLTVYREAQDGASAMTRFHVTADGSSLTSGDRLAVLESADWLRRIARILDSMEAAGRRVRPYRRNFDTWVDAALNIGKPWGSTMTESDICPLSAMDSLESLADIIATMTPGTGSEAHERLTTLLHDASDALDGDQTLSDQLRRHLRRVLDRLRSCVEHPEAYDVQDLAEAADDTVTSAKAAAGESTDKTWKDRWEKIVTVWAAPVITGLIANSPSLVLQITAS